MASAANPTGRSGSPGATPGSPPPSMTERARAGVGAARDSIVSAASNASEWRAVKTMRDSTVWSWISWPFSAMGSLLGGVWSRISKLIWGAPKSIKNEVTIVFPGYLWNSSVTTTTERAIRKGWLTIEQGVADRNFTLEQAQINGWVPVTIPGKMWGSNSMMLKTAIETGKMTVEQAIEAKHITEYQARQATWIEKK